MELDEILDRHELARERDFLAPFAHFVIALRPDPDASVSLGATRIGGGADAPADFSWPCERWALSKVAAWPEEARAQVADARANGQAYDEGDHLVMPLSFLMQIDLAAVHALDWEKRLPPAGLLLFFASVCTDVDDRDFGKRVAAAVRWVDAPRKKLVNHPQPPTVDPFPTTALALRAERHLSLKLDYEDREVLFGRLTSKKQEQFILDCVAESVDALVPAPAEECAGPMPPPGEIAIAVLADHADVGLTIGDASWITFTMPTADLAARKFDSARAGVFIG